MALTSNLSSKSDSIEDPSDAAAEEEAAQAREQGTDLIRDHLRGHLDQNPSSSYVVSVFDTTYSCVLWLLLNRDTYIYTQYYTEGGGASYGWSQQTATQ